jgi:hypothetical protein
VLFVVVRYILYIFIMDVTIYGKHEVFDEKILNLTVIIRILFENSTIF